MEEVNTLKDTVRIAKIDEQEVRYSACSEKRETYQWQEENSGWVYLGKGAIWTINGIKQNSDTEYHFWKAPTF